MPVVSSLCSHYLHLTVCLRSHMHHIRFFLLKRKKNKKTEQRAELLRFPRSHAESPRRFYNLTHRCEHQSHDPRPRCPP